MNQESLHSFGHKIEDSSERIETAIFDALQARDEGKSICPSEVARKLFPTDWREHMQEVRDVAYALRDKGELRVTQGESDIPDGVIGRGAIRLRF